MTNGAISAVFASRCPSYTTQQVLDEPSKTLGDLKLKNGAKLMMMSSGGGVQTGGQRAAQGLVEKRAQEAKARLAKGLGNGKDSGGNGSSQGSGGRPSSSSSSSSLAARGAGWAKTGVVSLRGEGIDEVPPEVGRHKSAPILRGSRSHSLLLHPPLPHHSCSLPPVVTVS